MLEKCKDCCSRLFCMSVAEVNGEDFETMANKKYCRKRVFTNSDRIRAMSDEELADNWMRDFVVCHRCAYRDECECDEYVTIEKCREGIVEWLKQPAEGE